MGKLLLMLFALLALITVLFANEMDWIDLKKRFSTEEEYSPPPRYGYIWRTTPGNGQSLTEKIFGSTTRYEFFQVSSSGEWSSAGGMTCGFMRCW
jgi:hypothetical protein